MDIKKIFKQVYDIAYDIQQKSHSGLKIDGKSVWKQIEKSVEHIKLSEMIYRESLNDTYKMMDKIIDKYCMVINEYYPKSNHFFMQLKNLVVKKSNYIIELYRILQLAFNAGQLNYFLNSSEYNTLEQIKDINTIFGEHHLDNLDTYISSENIKKINKILEKHGDINFKSIDMTKYLMKGGIRSDIRSNIQSDIQSNMKIYHLKIYDLR